MQWRSTLCCCGRYSMKPATRPYTMRLQILSDLHLVDSNSEIESERHVPDASGQGKVLTNKHSDSGAIARICNAAMIVARMAGTPIFTVRVHQISGVTAPLSMTPPSANPMSWCWPVISTRGTRRWPGRSGNLPASRCCKYMAITKPMAGWKTPALPPTWS